MTMAVTVRARVAIVGCLVAGLVLAACGESSSSGSLSSLMLSAAPTGYVAQPVSGGDGSLSIDDASSATPADPSAVHAFLSATSWRGAFVRVWTHGTGYAEDIGFAFADNADAQRFAGFEVAALTSVATDYVFADNEIPGGKRFILYSQTRIGNKNVFCNGVWFPYQDDAFELLTCGATPVDGQLASELSVAQLQQAGGTPLSPAPT